MRTVEASRFVQAYPQEVARLVRLLFSEPLPYMSGETIFMDGAQSIAH